MKTTAAAGVWRPLNTTCYLLVLICLTLGTACAAQAAKPVVIGVATTDCVRSTINGLTAGTSITLLESSGKARYAATLGKPILRCGGPDSGEPGYSLKTTNKFDLALALIGKVPSTLIVRSCASRESVHFLLLSSSPEHVLSHKLWYLGYDVEPDCTESDARYFERSP